MPMHLPHLPVSPPLFRAADIRAIEQQAAGRDPHGSLMERAGRAAADLAVALADESGAPILILAGPGNNGGDAVTAASLLRARGIPVEIVARVRSNRPPPDAAAAWTRWHSVGGTVTHEIPTHRRYSLVIDGLYGVGLKRPLGGTDAQLILQANALDCPRLALDVPSGLDSDTGAVDGCALRATHTLTFLGLKPGLITGDGRDYSGDLHLDTLGMESGQWPATPGFALTRLESRHQLPVRLRNSHKGDFGRVGIIGGSPGMVGACLIAGRAALQQGAGSVTLGVLDTRIGVDYVEPRLMFGDPALLVRAPLSVLAIGPGLGQDVHANALLKAALDAPRPLVLDADALNLLASDDALADLAARRVAVTLLTPHPGEAARLLGVTPADIQAHRVDAARQLSDRYRAHVALKGAGTVIAHPDGRYAINTTGGPWLAHAGSGDRLTGMVAALLAQGMAAIDALEAAVWAHGTGGPFSLPGSGTGLVPVKVPVPRDDKQG